MSKQLLRITAVHYFFFVFRIVTNERSIRSAPERDLPSVRWRYFQALDSLVVSTT